MLFQTIADAVTESRNLLPFIFSETMDMATALQIPLVVLVRFIEILYFTYLCFRINANDVFYTI